MRNLGCAFQEQHHTWVGRKSKSTERSIQAVSHHGSRSNPVVEGIPKVPVRVRTWQRRD